uniref:Bifunctional apoptosis regulator n=1 Tax=Pseudonaja textilis TaxID=8673 RepID=A0A670Z4C5_PSETE
MEEASLPWPAERLDAPGISRRISVSEFSCHCCYDILINPTTLNCGHSFCRHCLALWWMSSKRNECPECREKWEGFPKVNILLRNAVETLFPAAIEQRKDNILQNHEVTQSLAAFQKYGSNQPTAAPSAGRVNPPGGGFFSGVLTALTCVAVVLLGYHWSSRESEDGLLVRKPVAKWTAEEVAHWLGQLGPWTSLYRERFLQERVNGRLLLTLTDEDLRQAPYQVENGSHRKAITVELERVKLLGVKPPQNLWEYKAVQPGRSLFLLYALKSSPRLAMLYLYLSDYSDTFLPFIHTVCPVSEAQELEDRIAKLHVGLECRAVWPSMWAALVPWHCRRPPQGSQPGSWCSSSVSAGPQGPRVEAVAGVPGEVCFPALSAAGRVRLGLAGDPLLDLPLHHCERHAAVRAGAALLLEALVKAGAEVSPRPALQGPGMSFG